VDLHGAPVQETVMADFPYIVALALVEFDGKRALPLAGKSQSAATADGDDPGHEGQSLALELLLRVFQRSDQGALKRAAGEASLLLLEMPLEVMSDKLPLLKATWISGGDHEALLRGLKGLASRAWQIQIEKYQPVTFVAWA
jgi:hypothetical protein